MNKSPNLLSSFRFAFAGVVYAFRTQRNFKIHCGITLAVVIVGLLLRLSPDQWAILAVVTGLVFQAELVNTALEAMVDKVSPEYHELAKISKDCAAGAVVISAIVALITGALILLPRILALL